MNTICVSEDVIKSQEYKDSHAQLCYLYSLLKQQLEIAETITEKNERLISRAYFDYHVNSTKEVVHIPSNPVHKSDMRSLIDRIDKFFIYNNEYKSMTRGF